jgi:integrase/recombinase XerD
MRFDEFLKEREYLLGVSLKTLIYYRCAFNSWNKYATDGTAVTWIKGMKDAGIKAVSINTYICAMNAYWTWSGEYDRKTRQGKRLAYLKEEQNILSTFSLEQVNRLVHWKPVSRSQTRAHLVAMAALDTGLRINELLSLTRQNVDLDNLVLRVHGKGNKQRLVPMSIELRKVLYRHLSKHNHPRVFCTSTGTALTVRNSERDFKVVCRKAGITGVRTSWHTLRHSFAVNYLRKGGNLYYLQRILGHSSITTTERYLRSLGIEDLQKVHDGLTLLSHG